MNMKLFDRVDLGTESNEENGAAAVIALDPAEMIATAEAMADIEKVDAEYQVAHEAINLANIVVNTLENQIEKEKALVATPEAVNASTVILSSETLAVTASILGAGSAVVTVSQEAIEADPVESLKISTEAKESFVKKVIDNIKLMVKKFIAMLKKLYTKIVVAMSGTAKQAEALANKLKETKDAKSEIKLEGDLKDKIASKIGAITIQFGKDKIDKNLGEMINALLLTYAAIDIIPENIKYIIDKSKDMDEMVRDGEKLDKKDFEGLIDGFTSSGTLTDLAISSRGLTFKYLEYIKPELTKDVYDKDEVIKIFRQLNFKVTADTFDKSDFITTSVKFDDLSSIVDSVIKPAKDVKSYMDKVQKAVKNVEGYINVLAKSDDDIVAIPAAKFGNVFISNVAMELVLGHVGLIKDTLSAVNILANEATKKDK